jgi:hypothetical protein
MQQLMDSLALHMLYHVDTCYDDVNGGEDYGSDDYCDHDDAGDD